MHAVIRTGGKQYYVTAGDILEVEKLAGNVGDTIALEDVLLLAGDDEVTVGQPTVANVSVTAKITGQHRGQKIRVFRYRPKKRIRVRKGHRQYLTRLQIQTIRLADGTEFQLSAPAAVEAEEVVAVEPVIVEPIAEEPLAEEPMVEESVVEESVVEEAGADPVESTDDSTEAGRADHDSAVMTESENKE